MRVSCVNCTTHRDSRVAKCPVCGSFAVRAVECDRACCRPRVVVPPVVLSQPTVDLVEALALRAAQTDDAELRRLAGHVLDALRIDRSAA